MKVYQVIMIENNGNWLHMPATFKSEEKAEKYASDLVRDYPEVASKYIITWDTI